ncbi:MAG: hypothetical protein JXA73_12655, partial [Acidobacteria bacterium]|nr:hypothetical protein [Acidobacteriota bacterium]
MNLILLICALAAALGGFLSGFDALQNGRKLPDVKKVPNCTGKGKDMSNLNCRFTFRLVAAILCMFCVLLFCQCSKNNLKSAEIHLLLNRHPFTESILRFIPEYERQTGVQVSALLLSEEEYFEKLITELSSRSSFYDLFMLGFPHLW